MIDDALWDGGQLTWFKSLALISMRSLHCVQNLWNFYGWSLVYFPCLDSCHASLTKEKPSKKNYFFVLQFLLWSQLFQAKSSFFFAFWLKQFVHVKKTVSINCVNCMSFFLLIRRETLLVNIYTIPMDQFWRIDYYIIVNQEFTVKLIQVMCSYMM